MVTVHYLNPFETIFLYAANPNLLDLTQAHVQCELAKRDLQVQKLTSENCDFLSFNSRSKTYDIVVANPPFVRTQVLGGKRAKVLADKFNLSGRVDLYQVFTAQIARVLKVNGIMGLIVPNRFLTTKSGRTMRQLLANQFTIDSIFDLGDTRLF